MQTAFKSDSCHDTQTEWKKHIVFSGHWLGFDKPVVHVRHVPQEFRLWWIFLSQKAPKCLTIIKVIRPVSTPRPPSLSHPNFHGHHLHFTIFHLQKFQKYYTENPSQTEKVPFRVILHSQSCQLNRYVSCLSHIDDHDVQTLPSTLYKFFWLVIWAHSKNKLK